MGELVRIEAVPICATGTYELSTGTTTFTEEDLRAAVAALDDPAVHAPRIKIDGLGDSFDPGAHGGEPAFGYVDALRVSEDGQTLLGDLLVPDWLAAVIGWAYPSRSIEGMQGWQSPTGRKHDMVVTAVALLGVDLPGVSTLPDLRDVLADGPAEAPTEVIARMPAQPGRRIAAGIDQDLVRRRFYDAVADGTIDVPDSVEDPTWDLWVRSLRFDDAGAPYLKVQDDADARLYRVDFKVSGNDVTFGEFVEVVEQDVPVAATTRRPAPPLAVWASRDQSRHGVARPTKASASAGSDNEEETTIMDVDATLLRRRLGLPEDATEEQITAALAADPDANPEAEEPAAEEPAANANGDGDDEPETADEPAGGEVPAPVAASAIRQVRDLSAEVAELRAREAERQEREQRERRDGIVAQAIREGRIAPADRDHYRSLLDIDEDATRKLIEARARNTVPVDPVGDAREPDTTDEVAVGGDGLLPPGVSLLTASQRRRAAARR